MKLIPIFVFLYALNEVVVEDEVTAFDAGGTMIIFGYGSFFALVLSFVMAKKIMPREVPG